MAQRQRAAPVIHSKKAVTVAPGLERLLIGVVQMREAVVW
jgi:chemotaxis signal transduction protein